MNENNIPFVSVIVPCRDEEKFIKVCLESIICNDYPKDFLEILAVDGRSTDRTRELIEEIKGKSPGVNLRVIDNPKIITPAAMNKGIAESKGEIIIKMDAHAIYDKKYISSCVKHLRESGAENVGGVLKTVPSENTLLAEAIAISLSHIFGAGPSYFRIGSKEPKWVDTVAFGCYWKKTLEKLGGFDEKMVKIEDYELNWRLRKMGGKILLAPDITACYYPSSSGFGDFFIHNFGDGIWSTYSLKFGFFTFSIRHFVPLFFVSAIIFSFLMVLFGFLGKILLAFVLGSYLILSFYFSFSVGFKKGWKYFLVMPLVFAVRHVGYGLGSLWGLFKLLK